MLDFDGERYARKVELHVTLMGSRPGFEEPTLRQAALGLDFAIKPTGQRRRVREGNRRALIELVDVPDQEEFCLRLEHALGRTVPRMPAHVTLFTEPGGRGIALYSVEEFRSLSTEAFFPLAGPWL